MQAIGGDHGSNARGKGNYGTANSKTMPANGSRDPNSKA